MSHERAAFLSDAGLLFRSGYAFRCNCQASADCLIWLFRVFFFVLWMFDARAAMLGDRAVHCIRARNKLMEPAICTSTHA